MFRLFCGFWGRKLLLGRNSQKGLLSWSRVCRTSLFRLTLGCWELKHLVVELVILSKKTQSPDKKSRGNTSGTTTYKNFMSFWAQHLFCEVANTIFKGGKSEDILVIILSSREQLTWYREWYSSQWSYAPPWQHRGQLALRSWDAAVSRDLSAVFTITALGGKGGGGLKIFSVFRSHHGFQRHHQTDRIKSYLVCVLIIVGVLLNGCNCHETS